MQPFGLYITLTSISQSYYNWSLYKWYIDNGIISDLSDIGLAESKWGYSNVSTGAGIVVAQSSNTYKINLNKLINQYIQTK